MGTGGNLDGWFGYLRGKYIRSLLVTKPTNVGVRRIDYFTE